MSRSYTDGRYTYYWLDDSSNISIWINPSTGSSMKLELAVEGNSIKYYEDEDEDVPIERRTGI
jgi:hypothetical protein